MTETEFREILTIIEKWAPRGERTTSLGARLICPVPYIAPEAWLHALYRGLQQDDIDILQSKTALPFPNEFRSFLAFSNGAHLFANSIAIWGLRTSNARKGDEAWQPFDLELHNRKSEKPVDRLSNILMFGSSDKGENRLFFDTSAGVESSRVGLTSRNQFNPVKYWPDFGVWLMDECRRLSDLFDSTGKPKPVLGP